MDEKKQQLGVGEVDSGPAGHVPDVGLVEVGLRENFQHCFFQPGVHFAYTTALEGFNYNGQWRVDLTLLSLGE